MWVDDFRLCEFFVVCNRGYCTSLEDHTNLLFISICLVEYARCICLHLVWDQMLAIVHRPKHYFIHFFTLFAKELDMDKLPNITTGARLGGRRWVLQRRFWENILCSCELTSKIHTHLIASTILPPILGSVVIECIQHQNTRYQLLSLLSICIHIFNWVCGLSGRISSPQFRENLGSICFPIAQQLE